VRIVFTGDLLLGDQTLLLGMGIQSKWGNDYRPVFQGFCDWHRKQHADALVVNFEGVLVEHMKTVPRAERAAKAPLHALSPLRELGVPVLASVANNHSLEYGPDAFSETCRLLESAGFLVLGRKEQPAQVIRDADTTVGVLAFSTVPAFYGCEPRYLYVNPADKTSVGGLLDHVNHARTRCDHLVAYPHWGTEFMTEPSRMQRELAARLVASGVDLIVGAHPHVVQTACEVAGRPVYYSLGNLISDYPLPEVGRSAVVTAEFQPGSMLPSSDLFETNRDFQVSPIEGASLPLEVPGNQWPDDDAYAREAAARRKAVRNRMLLHLLKHLPKTLSNRALLAWLVRRALYLAMNRRRLAEDPESIYSGPIH